MKRATLIFIFLLISSLIVFAQDNPKSSSDDILLRVVEERKSTIKSLNDILDKSKSHHSLNGDYHQAILAVGQIRDTSCVSKLVDDISFLPNIPKDEPYFTNGNHETESFYPCANSLVDIGEPSETVKLLLNKIRQSNSPLDMSLSCWVLIKLRGNAAALKLLQDDIASYGGTAGQEKAAIDYVKNYKPSFGDPRFKEMKVPPRLIKKQ